MGTVGAKAVDYRVFNWNLSHKLKGHSEFFKKDNLEEFMPLVNEWIADELKRK